MRWILSLFFLCEAAVAAPTGEAEQLFARGNAHYAAGAFEEARVAYEAALGLAYSAEAFTNLGHAYAKQEAWGRALLNYRRALLLEPSLAVTQEAATTVAKRAGLASDITASWAKGDGSATEAGRALWWVVPGALWAAVGLGWLRRPRAAVAAGIAAAVALALAWSQEPRTREGMVVAEEAHLLLAPTAGTRSVGDLTVATSVELLDRVDDYWLVKGVDGRTGYVSSSEVEPLWPGRFSDTP